MTVYFFISSVAGRHSGKGGHYRSLLDMAEQLSITYKIIVLGNLMPDAYIGRGSIELCALENTSSRKEAKHLLRKVTDASVLHCYDNEAAHIVMHISNKLKIPLVVTKPGGEIWPRRVLPWKNMIVFQRSDYSYFTSARISPTNIALIPQRVSPLREPSSQRINPFGEDVAPGIVRIICIARFTALHHEKIMQAINLRRHLLAIGIESKVALVGTIHDLDTYNSIKEVIGDDDGIIVLTGDAFTYGAAELIKFSDFVVASGRSVPEALRCGKLVFVPVKDSAIPCMLVASNYDQSAFHNFTSRAAQSSELSPTERLKEYFLMSDSGRLRISAWAVDCFHERHSAVKGAEETQKFYDTLRGGESGAICLFRDIWKSAKVKARRAEKLMKKCLT